MKRVLAIALDAAEPSLVERWMEDGSLPTLQGLRERGVYGRLSSPAEWMTGSSWPTFYTGQNPAQHGFYNYLVWNPDKMTTEPPSPARLPLRPFWRELKDPRGPRAIVLDVPLTYAPESFNGKEIISLATHDSIVPMTGYPQEFVDSMRARFGGQIMSNERYGLQSKREFRRTRDETIRISRIVGDLGVELIGKEAWDLFFISFASVHRAGHRLWALHNIDQPLTPAEKIEFSDALQQVYIACDRAVSRLLNAAGPDTTILVFSLHGMRDNTTRALILAEMLRGILQSDSAGASAPGPGPLERLRGLIPLEWRHRVKSALPVSIRQRLTAFWRLSRIDWGKTPAFSMIADAQGWIRVNLKGREARGIVEPGKEYDDLCEKIASGLRTYVDADTNEPLVKNIVRSGQAFEGEKLDWLPDLIVQWNEHPANLHQRVVSSRYGSIPWPMPGRNPEGRSGNHFPQGMLIAAGDGIQPGNLENGHILDLAPTILTLLEQPVPARMEGKALF